MIKSIITKKLSVIEKTLGSTPNSGSFVFRGLSSLYLNIKPSLYYKQQLSIDKATQIESRLVNNFSKILNDKYDVQLTSNSLDLWLTARHFHLASRFIEFTRDFSVALKFSIDYALQLDTNAFLWVLNKESNNDVKFLDPSSISTINPFVIDDYYLVNPRLLLATENKTKLAYNRMFIQQSCFLIQPIEWGPIPITDKISLNHWQLFEIPKVYFASLSNEIEKKYDKSMSKDLLLIPDSLDDECIKLNSLEAV